MSLHLITGYAGEEHITSADQGAYNMGTFGEGEYVLDRGNKFEATVVTNNSISIADGEAMMQGRFIMLAPGTTETVSIDNGSQGMNRKDLICLHYEKDSGTGVESVSFVVKKGTESSSTPSDPSYTTGDITDGTDLVNETPLYRVNISGLTITSLDTMFSVKTSMVNYMDNYQLPKAASNVLGGVKIGDNINVASDGKISVAAASASTPGVLKVNSYTDGLYLDSGTIKTPEADSSYKGTVRIGKGLANETLTGDSSKKLRVKTSRYTITLEVNEAFSVYQHGTGTFRLKVPSSSRETIYNAIRDNRIAYMSCIPISGDVIAVPVGYGVIGSGVNYVEYIACNSADSVLSISSGTYFNTNFLIFE